MNSFKSFFKQRGLYLICLALLLVATITGVLAIRSVVNNVADLTQSRKNALEEEPAGYHRNQSRRGCAGADACAYAAGLCTALRIACLLLGAAAVWGSVRRWGRLWRFFGLLGRIARLAGGY